MKKLLVYVARWLLLLSLFFPISFSVARPENPHLWQLMVIYPDISLKGWTEKLQSIGEWELAKEFEKA